MTSQTPDKSLEIKRIKEISARIKIIRESLGLRQSEFADRLNKDVGTISRWERGEIGMQMGRRLREISQTFGVSPDWLTKGVGEMMLPIKRLGDSPSMARELEFHYRADVNVEILTQALDLVLKELERRKASLPASKIAAAVVEIYSLVVTSGKPDVQVENVTPFVNLLLAK